jgi:hypothetical protein
MNLIIENETNEIIYVDRPIGIVGIDFVGQEKIFYCTAPLYYDNITYERSMDFINIIDSFERKEVSIKKTNSDFTKYRYELNDDASIVKKIYEGECEKISFCLFYTKEPLRFYGYKNYVNGMEIYGYFVMGYRKENEIIFNILDHKKIIDFSYYFRKSKVVVLGAYDDFISNHNPNYVPPKSLNETTQ